ncbi:hypothetical protein PHYPSEUDO_004813 [Phytophthora pseudosyringae]|uniref:Uncharacterized protein n=1 Tax=Phytophthora pseudosyringae TaxID=221518 RepID=A0A8T1VQF3_9STRA|nr:hypothetical protein PHYPSEUDO_004813 [Phytophthora pseudosyringae]
MHRAEKSSSKICRAREVEKAQELHKKKIDRVKSYMGGTIPKPAASRSSASFHLRPARSIVSSFSSMDCAQGDPSPSAVASSANPGSSIDLEPQQDRKSGDTVGTSDTLVLDHNSCQQNQPLDEFQRSLAKMEEFREVAPVPGLGSVAPVTRHPNKFAPPPAGSRKKSLNGPFRTRRLKEIKADNTEVFERIRKSISHYRNDDLRREWQKNVSYLTSIGEFPVSADALTAHVSGLKQRNAGDDSRSCFGPSPRRPSFLRPTNRSEPLPSIPVVAHPIKCIPTSPKKLQLNMSPAFRSLRKAMPQQPSLPPISSPHSVLNVGGATDFGSRASNDLLSSRRDRSTCPSTPGTDDHFTESTWGHNPPFRSSTAIATTTFIGDLHGRQAENEVAGDAKYQLLKTGRFVGGTYLVLTVFCGDGVTNPYGFDVFAYHRELQCEYKLSITKEMTHELLEKSSSSSLAAETAAAAGTNLSMQEIARNICDHINFALLGSDQGEMVFLTPSVARKTEQAMQFDASPGLVAFCLHQTVEIERDEVQSPSNSSPRLVSSKRRAHVFASICPPKHYPGGVASRTATKIDDGMGTTGLTISFQVVDTLPPSRRLSSSCGSILKVEASVDELYDNVLLDSLRGQNRIVSMERMAVAAIQHLHIISVPTGDEIGTLRKELIVNSHVNTLLQPCSSRPAGTTALEKKRSRLQLPHSTSQLFTPPIRATILIQSGLIWRNGYLLAEIALDNAEDESHRGDTRSRQLSRRRLIQDADCDLIVSAFNSNSGRSTCRRLSPENTNVLLERLETKSKLGGGESISEQHAFAGRLLTYLQLDVDLFGQEVIVFPALEHPRPSSEENSATPSNDDAPPPQVHVARDHLPRTTSWEEDNISEGDEGVDDSDAYDEEELEEELEGTLPYDTDDEGEREEADASFSAYANQAEGDESKPKDEETPEGEEDAELATRLPRRQGRKIGGRFCLLQSSSDGAAGVWYCIAASGQLES